LGNPDMSLGKTKLSQRRPELVDLHLHSNASDGVDSPTRLVELAAEAGVVTMALMDHDTLAGIAEARDAAHSHDIELIAGTELSVDHRGTKMHMLVYFLEPGGGPLQDKLEWLRDERSLRNTQIIKNLNELGYEISIDDVLRHAKGPSVGRPHIADALVESGIFKTRNDAFADLLNDGGAGYAERSRLEAIEAVELARASGAVPVIAHPATIGYNRIEYAEAFRTLTDAGLGGIEAHHSLHDIALRERLTETAHQLGIAATGGSDFHGDSKREYRIGVGTGDLRVPPSAVDELRAQLGR
jgi:predicted metal-dependent phosphoesterase TrpH